MRRPPASAVDGRGGAVGDQAQPHQDPANERGAEEDRQDADDLAAVDQRVAAEAADAFPASPLGRGQPRRVRLKVGDLDRLPSGGDQADLAHAQGDAPVAPVKPRPVALLVEWPAGAGDKVQARRLVRALRARGAGGTLVARPNQPDPRQGDVGALGQAPHDQRQERARRPLLVHFVQQPFERLVIGLKCPGLGAMRRGRPGPPAGDGRRLGRAGGCGGILPRPGGGIVPCRPDLPQGVVETDVQPQLPRELRETPAILVQGRGLAQLASRQKLAKDQVNGGFRTGVEGAVERDVGLDLGALAVQPPLALVGAEHVRQFRGAEQPGSGQERPQVRPLTMPPQGGQPRHGALRRSWTSGQTRGMARRVGHGSSPEKATLETGRRVSVWPFGTPQSWLTHGPVGVVRLAATLKGALRYASRLNGAGAIGHHHPDRVSGSSR